MDAFEQSNSPGEQFYLPEMMRFGCTIEMNTGLTYDPRFKPSGIFTNLQDVEQDNGVSSILKDEPSYSHYVTKDYEKLYDKVSSWNRPTLNWSLECDANGPSRLEALDTVVGTLKKSDQVI